MPSSMYKLLLPVVCFPKTARNENRFATPSATDVTPTRLNQLGSGLSNVAARGEGSHPIPSVAPTLENERLFLWCRRFVWSVWQAFC